MDNMNLLVNIIFWAVRLIIVGVGVVPALIKIVQGQSDENPRDRNAGMEGFTFKKTGSTWKCVEHDSLVITADRRGWHWNSRGISGASAIDWCEKIYNHKFFEALQAIVGSGEVVKLNYTPVPEQERVFVLPESAENNKRVFAYLTQTRGIDASIVNQLIAENKLYQDTRGNCVFVGFDCENTPKYAGLRGTLSEKQFRGEVAGSDKRYSFSMQSQSEKQSNQEKLYIFESPIEAMSHASIVNRHVGDDRAFIMHNRLSLGGTSDVALVQYLQDNPNIKQLIFCLNNDDAGRNATSEMMLNFEAQGYTVRSQPPKLGDFNDDLLKADEIQENEIVRGKRR